MDGHTENDARHDRQALGPETTTGNNKATAEGGTISREVDPEYYVVELDNSRCPFPTLCVSGRKRRKGEQDAKTGFSNRFLAQVQAKSVKEASSSSH